MATANILSKMEYANDSADANKLNAIYAANSSLLNLPAGAANAVDANARNCDSSSAVDFLYLSTIRGGRKKMSGVSGVSDVSGDALYGGGCGCGSSGMKGGGGSSGYGYTGGCFTCPKGKKNMAYIYSTIHIVIPPLYKKYKSTKKAAKSLKKAKSR
jgi:hypothetical protein